MKIFRVCHLSPYSYMTDLPFASSPLNKVGVKSQSTQAVSLAKKLYCPQMWQRSGIPKAAMDILKSSD